MIKVTFTLDEDTIASLERTAARLKRPKSQIIREAVRFYGEQTDRLTEDERKRMLDLFDEVTESIPHRLPSEVEKELEEIRLARRSGGRGTMKAEDR